MTRSARLLLLAALAPPLLALLALAPALRAQPAPEPFRPLQAGPLDRAALLALPSVYRIDATVVLEGLRTASGEAVPLPSHARELRRVGTAFAAAPNGYLVAAAHTVAPDPTDVAASAYRAMRLVEGERITSAQAHEWAESTGARPVGARVSERVVRQASVGADGRGSAVYSPQVLAVDRDRDLALLRIIAPSAPALALTGLASRGTPVATVGFGRQEAFSGTPRRGELQPAVRVGELGRSGTAEELPGQTLTVVTADVRQGDSGAPAIDLEGAVRGMVLFTDEEGGILLRAASVRQLLDENGVEARAGPTAERFRAATQAFFGLRLEAAQRGFARTLAGFPQHALAGVLQERAAELARADLRLVGRRRPQGFLLALGVLAALGAAGCAIGLARGRLGAARGRSSS